ncbi:YihY/virulence factor BrkB family protein [Angustibacter sp. McL0619]|uniref:YihY/virulence factor BrkB family protein n=1 Tax=Angustibacter sp. McL0619 TaxID=3415676 RepID=UPI003CF7350A
MTSTENTRAAAARDAADAGTTVDDEPDPDDARKPDSPTDLHRRAWWLAVKRAFHEFTDDQCTDLAAALTYYAVLAIFPAAIALVSLVGVFGKGKETVDTLLQVMNDVGAGSATETLRGPLEQLASSQRAGLALVLGLATALWSASGYIGAFGRAMNRVYEIDEGRPFWKLRPLQILITLVAVIMAALVALALVVTGPVATAIGDATGLGHSVVTVWDIAKWPVIALVVVLVIAVLYYATPNVQQPKFKWLSVGAMVAFVTWVIASLLFGLYVSMFSSYDKTYGALAGVVVFLLWLWITNLALLFGAELDSELERSRQLQAGMAAETELQLPPRDDKGIRKNEEREADQVEEAAELRTDNRRA